MPIMLSKLLIWVSKKIIQMLIIFTQLLISTIKELLHKTYASKIRKLKDVITKLDEDATKFLELSKKYGEKSLELNPQDIYTMEILSKVYYRLQMYDESEEMKEKIEEFEK